jgi:agmatinase
MLHKTSAFFLPFDLFGSAGTSAGADALADAFQEMLADNKRERLPTRARAYSRNVRMQQIAYQTLPSYQKWRTTARRAARQALHRKDFLIWVTGNHLGVLPVYDELAKRKQRTLVIQFDAHLDIYNLSDCKRELSHGNYLMHCAGPLPPLVNAGSRELLLRAEHVKRYFQHVISAADFAIDEEGALRQLRNAADGAEAVFVDIECDVFDPAYFPATPHPLPFGLSPRQVLRVLEAVWSDRLIGLSISEFEPARDRNDQCLSTLLWLLEYILLKRYESSPSAGGLPKRKGSEPPRSSRR